MHVQPGSPEGAATTRPAITRGRKFGRLAAVTVLGAGLLALGVAERPSPAVAQLQPGSPMTGTGSFADIVERVKPAVVSVSTMNAGPQLASRDNGKSPRRGFPNLQEDHPLYDLFKNLPKEFGSPQPQQPRPRLRRATGSGFVVSADGYVVTNNHVIDGATEVFVSFDDQEKLEAELIGTDARTDIALLKIKNSNKKFPHVTFSDKKPRVGDWVLAVGNPFGLGGTVTAGIVSALARDIGSGPYDFMQIDAAVNRGNSGGPTFNLEGEVVGVNTAIYSPTGGNVGIAFAVPANTVKDVIEELKNSGSVSRGWLGVKIQNVDDDTAASLGLSEDKGALISEVMADGPAADAGLKVQDAILEVNGKEIEDSRDLARKIADFAPGATVKVKVWRNDKEKTLKVKLGKFPNSTKVALGKFDDDEAEEKPEKVDLKQLGLTLMPARSGGSTEGVAIAEVDPNSDAAKKGLKSGDVILEAGGKSVSSPADVLEALKKMKELGRTAVLLHIKTGDQKRLIPVQINKS
jgi:serine protease Do